LGIPPENAGLSRQANALSTPKIKKASSGLAFGKLKQITSGKEPRLPASWLRHRWRCSAASGFHPKRPCHLPWSWQPG